MSGSALPTAIERALPLIEAEGELDTARGYLDLLGDPPKESAGLVQAVWASKLGSALYVPGQMVARRVLSFSRLPRSSLRTPPGGRVLDVGCGPGDITAALGRAVGRDGLALGVDVSRPMLDRAARVESDDHVGFVRADAQSLPFVDASFDLVTSLVALQLIPRPFVALEQMARMVQGGGQLALLLATVRGTLFDRMNRLSGYRAGLRFFDPEEIVQNLRANGFSTVHTRQWSSFLWVVADKDAR